MLTASSDFRRPFRRAMLVLLALAGCAQPVDAPAAPPENDAALVAHLQAAAERISAELPGRAEGLAYPAPPSPGDAQTIDRQISPAEWKRLEEAARRELPGMIAKAEELAARR